MNRKFLALFALVALLVAAMAGTALASDPTVITTVEGLKGMTLTGDYKLGADIDLTGENWTPIGSIETKDAPGWPEIDAASTKPFSGTFDGGGFIIKGLKVTAAKLETSDPNSAVTAVAGLFGAVSGTLKNVTLVDVEIAPAAVDQAYFMFVGALAGATSGATIENCNVTGKVAGQTATRSYTGGLVGYAFNSAAVGTTVKNSTNAATVTGGEGKTGNNTGNSFSSRSLTGGIVGSLWGSSLEKVTNTGAVTGGKATGTMAEHSMTAGIAGYFYAETNSNKISGAVNTGDVKGSDTDGTSGTAPRSATGGILGLLAVDPTVTAAAIENCLNSGAVTGGDAAAAGTSSTGGVAGAGDTAVSTFDNCGNTGDVTGGAGGTGGVTTGGVIGKVDGGTVTNSFNLGAVKDDTGADALDAGIAGADGGATFTTNYSTGTVTAGQGTVVADAAALQTALGSNTTWTFTADGKPVLTVFLGTDGKPVLVLTPAEMTGFESYKTAAVTQTGTAVVAGFSVKATSLDKVSGDLDGFSFADASAGTFTVTHAANSVKDGAGSLVVSVDVAGWGVLSADLKVTVAKGEPVVDGTPLVSYATPASTDLPDDVDATQLVSEARFDEVSGDFTILPIASADIKSLDETGVTRTVVAQSQHVSFDLKGDEKAIPLRFHILADKVTVMDDAWTLASIETKQDTLEKSFDVVYEYTEPGRDKDAFKPVKLIGSDGATVTWATAITDKIVDFNASGDILINYLVVDGEKAPTYKGKFLIVYDGDENNKINDPLWLTQFTGKDSDPGSGSSGVGCDAGLGVFALIAAAGAAIALRRRG